MKKALLILILFMSIFILTGCENDASDLEKSELLKEFQKENYLPNDLKKVGESKVESGYIDSTPLYKNLDVYENNGKYFSINFDKVKIRLDDTTGDCDFIVEIYDHVTLLKDQEVTTRNYNEETESYEYFVEKQDIYKTDKYYIKKYCVYENKKFLTRKKYYTIKDFD